MSWDFFMQEFERWVNGTRDKTSALSGEKYLVVVGLLAAAFLCWFVAFWNTYGALDNTGLADALWVAGVIPAILAVIMGGFLDKS